MKLTKKNIEKKLLGYISKFKKDKQIIAVLLFGSYARKEHFRDIDLCLVLDKKYSNNEMTEKRLKYYSMLPNVFDIQVFGQLPLYIRKKILEEGKVLFCKDEDKLYEIAGDTVIEFEQFKGIYNSYIENALK